MPATSKLVFYLVFCSLLLIRLNLSHALEPPVVIGTTASMTGKYVEPSNMIQKATKLWVDEINQRGGLLGRKVKLVLYDDRSDAERTRVLYEKLITQDNVDIVFSPYSTPLTLAASSVSEAHQKLMIAVAAAAEKPWQQGARYLFQLYAPAKRQFIGLLDLMAKKNLRTLSVLYDDASDFNLDIVSGVQEWADIFKIKILYNFKFCYI